MNKLISNIRNIKIYDNSLFHNQDTVKAYNEYINTLLELEPLKLKYFIQNLKNREIINNQETELEESFLLELFKLSQRKDSIDITMNLMNEKLTLIDIKKIHRVVIKGSSDDCEKNYDYRKDNNKWVGSFGTNGEARVDYFPPDYAEIMDLMDVILDYLNEKENTNFENLFIKPMVAHALIAYLQPFGNGNTRLSRVLQHCKICTNTNEVFKTDFNKPILYLSKNYLLTRGSYRGLIKNLAVNQDDDAWNKWFNYNLNMIDEQIYYVDKQLTQYMKQM